MILLEALFIFQLVAAFWLGSEAMDFPRLVRRWDEKLIKLQNERHVYDGVKRWEL